MSGPFQSRDLTDAELRVLALAAQGHTNPEIARRLHLSTATVKSHLQRLGQVLGSRGRAHSVHIAHLRGLLTDTPERTR